MRNYIVFDLEWNQSAGGKEASNPDFPFEIIEIGAVKLNEEFEIMDEFHRLIRPQVYTKMHYAISEVTHMDMEELQSHGELFPDVAADFVAWCEEAAGRASGTGETDAVAEVETASGATAVDETGAAGEAVETVYCTWGTMDLMELQRNLRFYGIENPFPKPLFYYDVQKLYGLFYRDGDKPSLDAAVADLELYEDRPFHRALDDAWYTGKVLQELAKEPGREAFLPYQSIDYYRLPDNKKEEIRVTFPGYSKYVSRIFPSKEDAMKDRGVTEMMCYQCGRMLRKKVRWFTPNQKIYFALAICPEHGYLKGKIRMKKVDEEQVFVVKTLKQTDEEGAQKIRDRKEEVRKKRAQRNRMKKKKLQEEQAQSGSRQKKQGRQPGQSGEQAQKSLPGASGSNGGRGGRRRGRRKGKPR